MLSFRGLVVLALTSGIVAAPVAQAADRHASDTPSPSPTSTSPGNPWDNWPWPWPWPWPGKPTPTPSDTPTTTAAPTTTSPVTPSPTPTTINPTVPVDNGSVTQPPAVSGPHVSGNRTKETYDYANAIRESVSIQVPFDSDGDRRNDTIVMDVVRPREMADRNIKAPVVMVASPYFTSFGRGPKGEKKRYDRDGNLTQFPLWLDNYFVERGYAVAALDVVGTARSNGCSDVGGKYDIGSVTAAIDWLNGRGDATYLAGGRGRATADWSTGSVGMIGKSYDGTVANGAAATGVKGLRTIVPINAISSWYNYTRIHGINYRPDYMGGLGQAVTNDKRKCARIHSRITDQTDAGLGMNPAWRERDYVKDADKVNASVLMVHGQHDFNVFMENAGAWHTALTRNGVPTSMYLTQADHTDPFNIDRRGWVNYLHEWFDHWLSGLPTSVMESRSRVEHDLNRFTTDSNWPVGSAESIRLSDGVVGQRPGDVASVSANRSRTSTLLGDPSRKRDDRLMFLSKSLDRDVRVSGETSVTMRIRTNARSLPLTAKLVDYGTGERFRKNVSTSGRDCWGGESSTDSACYDVNRNDGRRTDYGVIGSGWLNAAFRDGVDREQSIPRGQWFDITIPIMASDNVLKAGHRFGIALYTTDPDLGGNVRADAGLEIDVNSIRFDGHVVGRDAISGDGRADVRVEVPEDDAEIGRRDIVEDN